MATDAPQKPEAKNRVRPTFSGDLPVDKDNLWKGDCANRKVFAEKFTKIIGGLGVENSKIFLLDGEWGSGKTYFLKNLRYEFENGGYKAIYFDAFAEDFSADPLLAICGQLWKELNANAQLGEKIKKEFGAVLKDIIAIGAKAVISVDVKEEAKNLKTMGVASLVEYAKTREKLENLKEKLSSVVKKCQDAKEGEEKPLVFIIDELDRCRPTFALELLERVKHLFEVPGIIFIFGAKKEALMASIHSQYGKQDDTYLEKFFDFDLKLPNAPSYILAREHVENSNIKNIENFMLEVLNDLYYPLMAIVNPPLRSAKRAVQMFQFGLLVLDKDKRPGEAGVIACLTLLKAGRPKLYADIVYGDGKCENLIKEMSPLFDKWVASNCNEAIAYGIFVGFDDHIPMAKCCRRLFNKTICLLAEGEEKDIIMKNPYQAGNKFGISNEDDWKWLQGSVDYIDRSKIIRMLENLGCQSDY